MLLWKVGALCIEEPAVADIICASGTTACETGCCPICPAYVVCDSSEMAIGSCGSLVVRTTVRLIHLAVAKIAQSKDSIISSKGPFELDYLIFSPFVLCDSGSGCCCRK